MLTNFQLEYIIYSSHRGIPRKKRYNMKITFAGHSVISSEKKIKDAVKEELRKIASEEEFVTFYIGGYGEFDRLCSCACRELGEERDGIEVVYVAPYISLSEQTKVKELLESGKCDTSIYPPIENTPPKFAIIKRNEWMMTNADVVIAYVEHEYGGAYRSLQTARRKKKKIINIYDII